MIDQKVVSLDRGLRHGFNPLGRPTTTQTQCVVTIQASEQMLCRGRMRSDLDGDGLWSKPLCSSTAPTGFDGPAKSWTRTRALDLASGRLSDDRWIRSVRCGRQRARSCSTPEFRPPLTSLASGSWDSRSVNAQRRQEPPCKCNVGSEGAMQEDDRAETTA